jgi:ABC-2 type transport system ATP-binding protein
LAAVTAIAGLILQERNVYILDEPFNGLDAISCITVQQILIELRKKNKLVIVSSHIIDTIYKQPFIE